RCTSARRASSASTTASPPATRSMHDVIASISQVFSTYPAAPAVTAAPTTAGSSVPLSTTTRVAGEVSRIWPAAATAAAASPSNSASSTQTSGWYAVTAATAASARSTTASTSQ